MGGRQGSVSIDLAADADAVFRHLTDVARLPEWNDRIVGLESPPTELSVGDRWTVQMQLPGMRFASVSEVLELDRGARHFVHRSKPDDTNPSHSIWTWDVTPSPSGGCTVRTAWSLQPRTTSRRLAAVMRGRMIPKEVAQSIERLGAAVGTDADA